MATKDIELNEGEDGMPAFSDVRWLKTPFTGRMHHAEKPPLLSVNLPPLANDIRFLAKKHIDRQYK